MRGSKIQVLNAVRNWHFTLRQALAMPVNFPQVIKVVDHQAKRLFEAFGRRIGRPIDLLDTGTIAQMKARHGVAGSVILKFLA